MTDTTSALITSATAIPAIISAVIRVKKILIKAITISTRHKRLHSSRCAALATTFNRGDRTKTGLQMRAKKFAGNLGLPKDSPDSLSSAER